MLCCLLAAPAALAARHRDVGSPEATSFSLLSQQPWVEGHSGVQLTLGISSPLPASRLGLKIALYSEVSTRDVFSETLSGSEPPSEVPIDSVPNGRTLPLASLLHNGTAAIHLPVATGNTGSAGSLTAPTLFLDCSAYCPGGVYPLQIVLIDRASGNRLASLTTYLVYAPPTPGALKLETALVLPVGNRLALGPSGAVHLSAGALARLSGLAGAIGSAAPDALSVDLHPQLLTALSRLSGPPSARRSAASTVATLRRALGGSAPTEELLGATFAPVDPTALAEHGLGGELATQLGVARRVDSSLLGRMPSADPAVSTIGLGPPGLALFAAAGIRDLVVPPTSLAAPVPTATRVAPYALAPSSPDAGGLVFASDAGLGAVFDRPTADPALNAMRFLAELAVAYFEEPFLSVQRSIVVAPRTAGSSPAFLTDVLAGLEDSPIVQPVTLQEVFNQWSGAHHLATTTLEPLHSDDAPSASSLHSGRNDLATLDSVLPAARSVTLPASDALLLGEATGLRRRARARYEGAPAARLEMVSHALSLASARTVTLTARTGRVPVTISSQFPGTVDVVMHVRSSNLTFPNGTRFPLVLTTRDHSAVIAVHTLTSGVTTLSISLEAPRGGTVLSSEQLSIHSTAISAVAILISLAALLVLAAWWARSFWRSRHGTGRTRHPAVGASS